MASQEKKLKILIIEDDVFMIDLMANELKNGGFEISVAKSGKEGIEKFKENVPDLVLLDILLPDQNGFETLRQIRKLDGGANVKTIVLSNLSAEEDLNEAKRLAVAEYLVKANYTLPEIILKIRETLEK